MMFAMNKNIISLFLTLSAHLFIYGQSPLPDMSSPQVYEMRRLGNIPVNLNVGTIDFNVDLLEGTPLLKENLNLSIGYNSTGFSPNTPSNYAGLNWFLNYGGFISRKVNGVPDDYNFSGSLIGYWVLVKPGNGELKTKTNADVFNGNFPGALYYGEYAWKLLGSLYEVQSDEYFFNFNNKSGSFTIDIKGNVILHSEHTDLRIDLSEYNIQGGGLPSNGSIIKILDELGNEYIFGGSYNYLEIRFDMGGPFDDEKIVQPYDKGHYVIDAWYLKEVNLVNGKKINYKYNEFFNDPFEHEVALSRIARIYNHAPLNDSSLWRHPKAKYNFVSNFTYKTSKGNSRTSSRSSRSIAYSKLNTSDFYYYNTEHYSLLQRLFPSSIYSNDFEINFDYNYVLSTNNKILDYPTLKSIKIYNKDLLNKVNEKVEEINFSHNNIANFPFLVEINSSRFGKYTFDYYYPSVFPVYPTRGIDYLGFWNGKSDVENPLLTDFSYDIETGDYTILSDNRKENINLYNSTLLKKVVYPTKGYSLFIYEPHYYSKKIQYGLKTNFFKLPKFENGSIGGGRIKSIKSYSADNVLDDETEYIYELGLSTSSTLESKKTQSSGISLLDYFDLEVVNYEAYIAKYKNYSFKTDFRQVSYNLNEFALDKSVIAYSEVTELRNKKLYKKYYYSDYFLYPDEVGTADVRTQLLENNDPNLGSYVTLWPARYSKYFENIHTDESSARGRLIQEDHFINDKIQQSTSYQYLNLRNKDLNRNKYSTNVRQYRFHGIFTKKPFSSYKLVEKTIKFYVKDESIESVETYNYASNKSNLLTSKIFRNNNNELIEEKYKYIFDPIAGTIGGIEQEMINKNMLNYVVNHHSSKNGILQGQNVYKYNKFNNKLLLESKYKVNKNGETGFFIDGERGTNLSNSKLSSLIENGILEGTLSELFTIQKYDEYGNILQYRDNKGIITSLYYANNLPVLKMIGVPYDYFPQLPLLSLSLNEGDYRKFKELCLIFNKKNDAFIEGYIYKPLVGLIQKIDSKGNSTHFEYDESNRLKSIKDDKGNVLEEYEYNYKQ